MGKHIQGVVTLYFMLLMLGGCDMNRYPLTSFSEETFYSDEANIKLALNGIYRGEIFYNQVDYNISDWWSYSAIVLLDGVSDIGYDRRGFNNNIGKLTSGQINENNGFVELAYQRPYKRISACCRFLDGIDRSGIKGTEIDRMRAEARFIRAVQYFYLASYWHDVPLVKTVLSLDEANSVTKSSRKDVLEYAANELGEVSKILPRQKDLPSSELGRATAQAALAYLARTYLLLHDFEHAALACKQIIDWGDNVIDPDYQKLFYPSGKDSKEIIFAVQFVDDLAGNALPQHAYPIKNGGWCIVNPSSNLFEAYDFIDGTPFSYDDARFDKDNFGANRDPRLDYTIYYDGATFKGEEYICHPESNSSDKISAGTIQATQTGFLMRKYFDETWSGNIVSYGNSLPLARYADVLLMYLEAELQSGKTINQTLLDETINKVRGRKSVNMPPISETSPDKLMKIIQKERMIELAFEGWRLWDLYRWGIAKEKLNQPVYGSTFQVSDDNIIKKRNGVKDQWNRWYVNTRSFEDGQEVWPIPLAEKNINPNLR